MAQRKTGEDMPQAVSLSKRLLMLADMVTPGNRVADVGCDHGFLSIYLVQTGRCPGALAMDVRTGPLEAAKAHVAERGLGSYIELRLSDGLTACRPGEAHAVVCAGMGGRLMERILTEGMDRAREMRELILQPQSELPRFRAFLRETGFAVTQEDAVFEEGKYYFAMKAVYGGGGADGKAIAEPWEAVGAEAGRPERGAEAEPCSLGGREAGHAERKAEAEPCESVGREAALAGDSKRERSGQQAEAISRQRLYDLYGKGLLAQRHPVLLQYLLQRQAYLRELLASLAGAGTARAQARLVQVERELEEIEGALAYYPGRL